MDGGFCRTHRKAVGLPRASGTEYSEPREDSGCGGTEAAGTALREELLPLASQGALWSRTGSAPGAWWGLGRAGAPSGPRPGQANTDPGLALSSGLARSLSAWCAWLYPHHQLRSRSCVRPAEVPFLATMVTQTSARPVFCWGNIMSTNQGAFLKLLPAFLLGGR